MNLQLGSDTEARIKKRISTGKYATPADVVIAGLQLLEEREQTRSEDLRPCARADFHRASAA